MAGACRDTIPQMVECQNKIGIQQLPQILQYVDYRERKGASPRTAQIIKKRLALLAHKADLTNPIEVETAIAKYKKLDQHTHKPTSYSVKNTFKNQLCSTYLGYCNWMKITWEKATYTDDTHSINPPTTEKCKLIVASAKGELSIKIDVSRQTGFRPIEITGEKGITPNDIHPDTNTITSTVTKGCNGRTPTKVEPQLIAKLQAYILRHQIRPDQPIFKGNSETYSNHFLRLKHRLAIKLQDPSILSIRLYDLRHTWITEQLRRTQNTETVRQMTGHKRLDSLQKYLHLAWNDTGEWLTEQTQDRKRADELTHSNWIFCFTTPDGWMQFKKAK